MQTTGASRPRLRDGAMALVRKALVRAIGTTAVTTVLAAALAVTSAAAFWTAPPPGGGRRSLPLHAAARSGDVGRVRRILAADRNALGDRDGTGATALHEAVSSGRAEVVRLLLSRGADPCAADTDGRTPLHCALRAGRGDG